MGEIVDHGKSQWAAPIDTDARARVMAVVAAAETVAVWRCGAVGSITRMSIGQKYTHALVTAAERKP